LPAGVPVKVQTMQSLCITGAIDKKRSMAPRFYATVAGIKIAFAAVVDLQN
jgi:hypothetical protein